MRRRARAAWWRPLGRGARAKAGSGGSERDEREGGQCDRGSAGDAGGIVREREEREGAEWDVVVGATVVGRVEDPSHRFIVDRTDDT